MGKGGDGRGPGDAGGGGGARRWRGRQANAWANIHICDAEDSLGLFALSRQVSDGWIDWNRGGRREPDTMHVTVLLKMNEPDHLPRLQQIARQTSPFDLTLKELFVEHMDRIKDAEVYCIGVSLHAPGLRAFKSAFVAGLSEEQRLVHVPYESDGHISLAYIRADCKQQAEQFVAERQSLLAAGKKMFVQAVHYQDQQGQHTDIILSGTSVPPTKEATGSPIRPPPSKGARLTPQRLVEIDGSVLEGGGQILRMSSAYSALFTMPVQIEKIRAGRSKPGLAAQHLESLRIVRDVSRGTLKNDFVGSTDVHFSPKALVAGTFSADPGTAGAITLMVQASLFPLLFAGGSSHCDLRGGTDVSFSPPFDFMRRVLLPILELMGVRCNVDCATRGFFPRGGGHVRLDVPAFDGPLSPIDLSERGEPSRVEAVVFATQPVREDVLGRVRQVFQRMAPAVDVSFSQVQGPPSTSKLWLDVVVEMSTGALFHGSSEPKDFPGTGKGGRSGRGKQAGHATLSDLATAAANEAYGPLSAQLATGAAVDEHLIDQLILPASLARGRSLLLAGELSLHAQTAIHIAELMVPGVRFNRSKRGACTLVEVHGIGHTSAGPASSAGPAEPQPSGAPVSQRRAPAAPPMPPALEEEVVQLARGALSAAPAEMLGDFRTDMGHLSQAVGAEVSVDVPRDRLLLRGGAAERRAAQGELRKITDFYFGNR